jgi:valyl-tRNA synthetase
MPQWFVKMKPLAEKAMEAVKRGKIEFIPKRFLKTYFHWLRNIRDWNISRQIVWGIRIPTWYKRKSKFQNPKSKLWKGDIKEEIYAGMEAPKGDGWTQDPDVFDTWFSSGQWPFLTLGFKGKGSSRKDFKTFYPTDVMETAYEILFFWVARMIMLGLYRTGKAPFKTVYLHGLVRDQFRQKMSKSKGNVIDPTEVAKIYGTDAVRMSLVAGNTPGTDLAMSEDRIRGYRNFATKIWNAARFVLLQRETDSLRDRDSKPKFTAEEKKIRKQLEETKKKTAHYIETFQFHRAAETVYHYVWHTFADKIIEESKEQPNYHFLTEILRECLKMLHPFMPFITETIYQKLPESKGKMLMMEKW